MLKSERIQNPGNLQVYMQGGAQILLRCPAGLKARAVGYAQDLGISLNALLAVALKDYLDARESRPKVSPPFERETANTGSVPELPVSESRQQRRARERHASKRPS